MDRYSLSLIWIVSILMLENSISSCKLATIPYYPSEIRLMPGDEVRLLHESVDTYKRWDAIGTVIKTTAGMLRLK